MGTVVLVDVGAKIERRAMEGLILPERKDVPPLREDVLFHDEESDIFPVVGLDVVAYKMFRSN